MRFLSDAMLELEESLYLHYREYIHYLKCNHGCLSAKFCLWNVPSKCPAIISQHTATPLALVLLFHCGDVLVKSLSVIIAHCPEIFWGKSLTNKCTLHYLSYFCRFVQVQPPYSFLLYCPPKIGSDIFEWLRSGQALLSGTFCDVFCCRTNLACVSCS